MAMTFEGQVAWVTGASSGIGRAVALELARQGADVAVSARREDKLEEVAAEIEALGRRALVVPCDVTEEATLVAAVARVVAELGRLDLCVANAGCGVGGAIADLTAAEWRRQLDVNVVGVALTAKHALPHLVDSSGRLALVGSVMAMMVAPKNGAYSASKYAVRAIGQTLAMELHGTGVSCTTVHPGFVNTDIARVNNSGVLHPEREDRRPQKLMWPADKAARAIVRAIARRKREVVFTGHGKVGAFVGRHWPGLIQLAATRR